MKQKLITIVLSLIVTLMPLLVKPNPDYALLKFWVLILGGIALLILLLASYRELKIDKRDIILFVFLTLIFISALFSSNIFVSILGSTRFHAGFVTFIFFVCIYLAAKKFFHYEKIEEFLNILFYSSLFIGIFGILQNYISIPALSPLFDAGVCSTFGNSNYFGTYISLILPASIVLFILKESKKGFILSSVLFFNLLSSGTRSAWVSFGVIAILGIIYLVKQKNKVYFKRFGILSICFIAIYLLLTFLPMGAIVHSKSQSLKSDLDITLGVLLHKDGASSEKFLSTGSGRMDIWRICLNLVGKKPLFGCGPDNLRFGIVQNFFWDAFHYASQHSGSIINNAHNEYLHIAATMGIPALIVYLLFLGSILRGKLKYMFQDKVTFTLCLVIIGYLTQALFINYTLGIAPLFWMILGLADNPQFKDSLGNLLGERRYLK